MSARLDAAAIRARRLEVGISERKLAALTGLGQAVIRGIEPGISGDLTLRDLDRVAHALSMDTLDLLATDAPAGPPVAGPATLVEHLDHYVGIVGALLYDIDRLIPVESLALTIGLSLEETHRVIGELDRRARTVGLLVHRLGNSVKLARPQGAVPHDFLRSAWRAHLGRRPGPWPGPAAAPGASRPPVESAHQRPAGHRC